MRQRLSSRKSSRHISRSWMSGKKATLRREQEAVHRAADTVSMVRLAALAVLEVTGISVATETGLAEATAGRVRKMHICRRQPIISEADISGRH